MRNTMLLWILVGQLFLMSLSTAGVIPTAMTNLNLEQRPDTRVDALNTKLATEKVFTNQEDLTQPTSLTATEDLPDENCTEPSIKNFPAIFSMSQLRSGAIAFPLILSAGIFYAIAYLCESFFVPSVEIISKRFHISSDVAGATLMAIATSSPEFFTNMIGTFLVKGDIGVGSVVGSVVFNLLVIVAWCGLFVKQELKLDIWCLTRDCGFYVVSVLLLIAALGDGKIYWYESTILLLTYVAYLIVMAYNKTLQDYFNKMWNDKWTSPDVVPAVKEPKGGRFCDLIFCGLSRDGVKDSKCSESSPLLGRNTASNPRLTRTESRLNMNCTLKKNSNSYTNLMKTLPPVILISAKDKDSQKSFSVDLSRTNTDFCRTANSLRTETETETDLGNTHVPHHETMDFFQLPKGKSWLKVFEWVVGWPIRFVLHATIPDCRMLYFQNWYFGTFLLCMGYMALFSYLITWMMTIIGQTLGIPDAVMGLTAIAAGTSLPEAISSIIVAKQGLGTMSISNSVGSNTFNILVCLGLPWLFRNISLGISSYKAGTDIITFIPMEAGGFSYVSIFLILSAVVTYVFIAFNNFCLDFKIGASALFMYLLFAVLAIMLELNVFFFVNLPTCFSAEWN